MAAPAQSFQFNNMVVFDLIEAASNSLATSAYATAFNKFDNNPYDGVSMRLVYPQQILVEDGLVSTSAQSIDQRFRFIELDKGYNSKIQVNSTENNFLDSVDSQMAFSNRYLKPAIRKMANKINAKTIADMAIYASDMIGSASSALNGINSIAAINAMVSNMGLDHFGRKMLQLSPNATSGLQVPYVGYFNEGFNASILDKSTTEFDKNYSGITPYIDQNYFRVLNGGLDAVANTVTVSVAPPTTESINSNFSTITVTGLPVSATGLLLKNNRIWFTKGSTDTLIEQINQDTYEAFGNPKYFVVVSDSVDSNGSGVATFNVFPPIVSNVDDAYRNVNLPLEVGDTLHVFGSPNKKYTLNFLYVPDALQFANPPISTMPGNGGMMGFGGFAFQQIIDEKIPNSMLSLRFNLLSQGDGDNFLNNLYVRSRAAAASFNGMCFAVASVM